jgi:hypothetical protein
LLHSQRLRSRPALEAAATYAKGEYPMPDPGTELRVIKRILIAILVCLILIFLKLIDGWH